MYNLTNPKKEATRDGYGKALLKLGEQNKDVVVLCASVGDSTKAFDFRAKFPDRYIEAGIAEQSLIGLSAGLALSGKMPFPSAFASFLPGRCYDQIRQSVCYSNLNVKLAATHAGLTVGPDGATHQMMEDIAMMRATPNMTVISPCDSLEAEKATLAAGKMKGPVYLRLGREKLPVFTSTETPFEIGKAVTLKEGKDVTIIATGIMVYYALLAAEALEKEKISARVINIHTIKPIDKETIIAAAKETKRIVTAEEHQVSGGLGSAVAEVVCQNCPVPMKIIGMPDRFGESGPAGELLKKYGLTDKEIKEAVHDIIRIDKQK
ncbi:MAG: transketolase family protein [Nanoarchaeota archaeon]|nr:transketolase family protein [Nanoarchaeota archaeon]